MKKYMILVLLSVIALTGSARADCFPNLKVLEQNIKVVSSRSWLNQNPASSSEKRQLKKILMDAYGHYKAGNHYRCEQVMEPAFEWIEKYFPHLRQDKHTDRYFRERERRNFLR